MKKPFLRVEEGGKKPVRTPWNRAQKLTAAAAAVLAIGGALIGGAAVSQRLEDNRIDKHFSSLGLKLPESQLRFYNDAEGVYRSSLPKESHYLIPQLFSKVDYVARSKNIHPQRVLDTIHHNPATDVSIKGLESRIQRGEFQNPSWAKDVRDVLAFFRKPENRQILQVLRQAEGKAKGNAFESNYALSTFLEKTREDYGLEPYKK